MFNPVDHPHRRFNPLTEEWVLVSPHRTKRPWLGQVEALPPETRQQYDPDCYLCPGNARSGGARNPVYESTFVFQNDFSALLPETPAGAIELAPLARAESMSGLCRVVCFSPRHDLTIAEMEEADIRKVVDCWVEQYVELNATPGISYAQIFENRGGMMGCSNPHPHCQIWASSVIPNEVAREVASQRAYWRQHERTLLAEYLDFEVQSGERVVAANASFVAVVPFWAVWPFETLVIPRRAARGMDEFSAEERDGLASILKSVTTRYDNLFETSFPYSMGFHQRPAGDSGEGLHFHAHFFPPLLRSATVRKFLVGYEMLAMPQRDITPESAAQRLRELPAIHYRQRR
jgi:UDPglucose--hexose-1-phosphate uridylyltransferase